MNGSYKTPGTVVIFMLPPNNILHLHLHVQCHKLVLSTMLECTFFIDSCNNLVTASEMVHITALQVNPTFDFHKQFQN